MGTRFNTFGRLNVGTRPEIHSGNWAALDPRDTHHA